MKKRSSTITKSQNESVNTPGFGISFSPMHQSPPYHHHQHLSQKQPKDSNSSTGFPSPSTMPSLPPPQVGQPDTKKPTSRMTSSPKPIHTTTVGDMMKKIEPTLGGHHQQAFISMAIPQPPHKTGKPVTSTPSTSMLMAAEHDASLPHNMLTKSQNQSMTTPGAGIPFSHVMLAPHHSPPISIQTHGSIVTPAVIQTPSGDGSKNEPRNTSIGAGASGNINTAHSPRPGKTPGRKRKPGPDIQMEASKRSPPVRDREESRESGPNILPPLPPSLLVNAKSQVSKQVLEEFMPPDEGKEKIKMETLPEGFDYDPYLPMSKELQLLSFENQQLARQKKFEYQQQQQMAIEQLRKEEQSAKMRAAKPHSRKRQKTGVSANSTSTSPHSTRASTPPPSTRPRGIISNVHFSPLNTLVNVAVSMESVTATSQDDTRKVPSPLKEKSRNRLNFDSMPPPQQAKPPPTTTTAKFVSIVDYATNDNKKSLKEDVPRSTSPRPDSLMPDQRATQTRRSPSPSGFNKFKVQEGQFVGLPPFEDPPIVVKPKTAKATFGYGPPGVDPTVLVQSNDEGHDSDSSGSGSTLHSSTSSQKRKGGRRKKQQQQQMAIEQLRKEEQSAKMRAAKPCSRKRQKTGVSANRTSTSPHSTRASTPPPSTRPRGIISNVHFSPLNTLVNVAVSMESVIATSQDDTRKVPSPLKEKSRNRLNFDSMPPPQQAKPPPTTTTAKFVSIVDYATNDNKKSLKEDVPRSTSPRPDSLMPDQRATQTRRSPSPSGFNKFKVQEGQFVGLPPFEDPPIVVKPKTAKATFGYGPPGVDPTVLVQSKDEGHDSDSSGSGSILHSSTSSQKRKGGRRKKRAEPLSVLKTDSTKIPREEQGMKQPEAPSLAPMTLGDFKLKIQPISPGIDVPPYHHHQHLSQKQPKDSNTPPPSTRPGIISTHLMLLFSCSVFF